MINSEYIQEDLNNRSQFTREAIVQEARTWLNTPFHHQGRVKGAGCDCAGLVVGVAKNLKYQVNDVTNYAHTPDSYVFQQTVETHLDKINMSEVKKGDILTFSFLTEPHHIAIVTDIEPLYIIHSYSRARKVVEHILDSNWKEMCRGAYRFRGVQE